MGTFQTNYQIIEIAISCRPNIKSY